MRTTTERVERVLAAAPIVDGHNDLPWALRLAKLTDLDDVDLTTMPQFHTDLDRLRRGGVGVQWWSVYVPSTLPEDEALAMTIEQVQLVVRMVEREPHRLALVTTAAAAETVVASGRIASLLGAEGGHSIGGTLAGLDELHALGVRYLTLTHNDNTSWADAATDVPRNNGLSGFGRDVVRRMNALGVIVDLSHVSPATMSDALDTTTKPVLFTHSCARTLTDHVRNVPDDILGRLGANGGVCMVSFVAQFVSEPFRRWCDVDAKQGPRPRVTIDDVVAHVEHVRDVAGVDHVGLAGDYDGCDDLPEGLGDVTGYPALLHALAERGWSDGDLMKLSGRNAMRVLADNTG